MPAIVPTGPDMNAPADNPADCAFTGLTGGNNGPSSVSMSGPVAAISRPAPNTALYTDDAAAQNAVATSSTVGVAGSVAPAVAAAATACAVAVSVSIAYCAARSLISTSMIDGCVQSAF